MRREKGQSRDRRHRPRRPTALSTRRSSGDLALGDIRCGPFAYIAGRVLVSPSMRWQDRTRIAVPERRPTSLSIPACGPRGLRRAGRRRHRRRRDGGTHPRRRALSDGPSTPGADGPARHGRGRPGGAGRVSALGVPSCARAATRRCGLPAEATAAGRWLARSTAGPGPARSVPRGRRLRSRWPAVPARPRARHRPAARPRRPPPPVTGRSRRRPPAQPPGRRRRGAPTFDDSG